MVSMSKTATLILVLVIVIDHANAGKVRGRTDATFYHYYYASGVLQLTRLTAC